MMSRFRGNRYRWPLGKFRFCFMQKRGLDRQEPYLISTDNFYCRLIYTSVSTLTATDWPKGVQFPARAGIYFFANLSGCARGFRQGQSSRSGNLTIHLQLMPRLRMRGDIIVYPLSHFMVWCLVLSTG